MTDRIFLDNVRLRCRIGTTPEERQVPQDVLLDISLLRSLWRAAATDNLDDTINYKEARERISQFVLGREFKLLESLAEGVASLALDVFGAERVVVKARKAKYSGEPSIGVEIERDRS